MDLLEKLKALQAEERLAEGNAYNRANEYIVVNELGDPVRPEWYSDQFHRISKRASVKDIRLHSVRHSLAFWLHQNGVAPADAATFLGHTVEVHLSTYLPASSMSGIARAALALKEVPRSDAG